jgi:membrane protease YdiL (CAAX protease family)
MSNATSPINEHIEPCEEGAVAVFPDLQWRGRDVLVGVLPVVVCRIASPFIDSNTLGLIAVPLSLLFLLWVWFYPVTIAAMRGTEFRWPSMRQFLMEALIAGPTLIAVWVGIAILLSITKRLFPGLEGMTNPFTESIAQSNNTPLLWIFMLAVALAGPIGEELFFRGMIYGSLKRYVNFRFAMFLQGILFGFVHSFGVFHSIFATFLGIAFAIVYELRKTIVAPICLHVLQNSIALCVSLWIGHTIANGPALGVNGVPHAQGCEITHVHEQSGAETAGLQKGDIVVELGGKPISNIAHLKEAVREHQIGDRVLVRFYRGDELHEVEIELNKRLKSLKN